MGGRVTGAVGYGPARAAACRKGRRTVLSRLGWRPSSAGPAGTPGAGAQLMQAVEVSVRDPEQGGEAGPEGHRGPT